VCGKAQELEQEINSTVLAIKDSELYSSRVSKEEKASIAAARRCF